MADLNPQKMNSAPREYDELDKALAARPALKAPRHTSASVMAMIAALPQTGQVVSLAASPVAKYQPPAVQPLPELNDYVPLGVSELDERKQRRFLMGLIFTGAWSGLCLLLLWAIWPAVSFYLFGPSSDPEMQAHLEVLRSIWSAVTGGIAEFLATYGSLLPTLASGAVGLGLMTAFLFGPNFRRALRTE